MKMRVRITRNVIAGPGKKFKRGDSKELDFDLARALISGGSAVLDDQEEAPSKTDAPEAPEIDDDPYTPPEIDDDLVVADDPATPKKSRRKKG